MTEVLKTLLRHAKYPAMIGIDKTFKIANPKFAWKSDSKIGIDYDPKRDCLIIKRK